MMNERRQTLWMIVATLALLGVIAGAPLLAGRFQPGRTSLVSVPGRSRHARPVPLPAVGSYENLKKLIRDSRGSGLAVAVADSGLWGVAAETKSFASPQAAGLFDLGYMATRADSGFSQTNVQTRGVDEADIVKTDGEYIYRISDQKITITKAIPAGAMRVVASIKTDEAQGAFSPQELYLDDRRLVVIGTSMRTRILPDKRRASSAPGDPDQPVSSAQPEARAGIMPPETPVGLTKLFVYDISDKSAPRKIREAALEGDYVSSRKIGPALFVVANRYIDGYAIDQSETDSGSTKPAYMDSASADKFVEIDYSAIKYFPNVVQPNYLMVAGINLDKPDQEMQVSTYLGAGQNVYASAENLYVAVTQFTAPVESRPAEGTQTDPAPEPLRPPPINTRIYKFALGAGEVDYLAQGEVPGMILSQYSMDESAGHFRLTTNSGDPASSAMDTALNNLYVLDSDMKTVGKLEGLAPGERIYSTRFMGERAYVVTFKQVDPLFVIDLKEPTAPKVLGQLKIPGYSDYLHPYDDDHIIGFGKDTVEAAPDPAGGFSEPTAFYQGMKIAVFDVSDVAHPVEQFKTIIGDRGTDSELLHNPKALLFDKARNLMAFPVTVAELKETPGAPRTESPGQDYGEFTFQGAYIYDISLDKGLNIKGRITHQNPEDKGPGGMDPYGDGANIVDRALYIGDTLYTVSKAGIKANRLDNLKEIGRVDINR